MSGEQQVAAPRQRVWEALNDPAVLSQCIPGCQSLEKEADDRFAAVAEVKIGPIGARFKGNVQLSEIDAPNGYVITGSGNGGIAGSAKGGARVRLADGPGGSTIVSYTVDAEVGGRMAQLGGPIIDATARNLAGKFFAKFGEVVSGTTAPAPQATDAASAAAVGVVASPAPSGSLPWGWIAALVAALLSGYWFGLNAQTLGTLAVVVALMIVVAAAAFEAGRRGGRR
ncbi:MAG: CoxG family protein [Novosphingobium sp.]